jgi:hypothetical protein
VNRHGLFLGAIPAPSLPVFQFQCHVVKLSNYEDKLQARKAQFGDLPLGVQHIFCMRRGIETGHEPATGGLPRLDQPGIPVFRKL